MTKIIYNGESKNGIINSLTTCINDLGGVNDIFYNIDIPYDFKYKDTLNNIRESLKKNKEDISNYKDDINRYMEEVNKNELEISSWINQVEDSVIEKF